MNDSRGETLPPAKKSLGQCFLVERSYTRQIVQALGLHRGDEIVEIGPGRGILTAELLAAGARVIAVEIDQRLLEPLQSRFADQSSFSLIHRDFLETDLRALPSGSGTKVCGNLPYHLAADVLYKLFAHARRARTNRDLPWIESAVLMMQREVAERVTAVPGNKSWGKLSVFAQLEAQVSFLFTVPATAFRPTPKVDGGVVRLEFLRIPEAYPRDFLMLERIVRYTFSQRRKMLKSSLASMPGVHPHWKHAPLDFRRRPETLTPHEWVELSDVVTDRARRSSSDSIQ